MQGFAPHPSSFIGIKEPKELHFINSTLGIAKIYMLSYILYIFKTYKAKKLALFGSFCGGKKNNKKIDKLKNF
ncbi:hypothetical protein BPP43_10550 [Brachyspira pilosicoli P43/6/78]|uniref:Uncharacterized protein n=1 Tax=Brachyspira pilosicoli P43/6/78 TaxID=1042417 RepID=A0A3B6VND7_BRAPL|nr:hypothetical protein BPP43_10550 [Brachyspira pilosicoli P43/6/78]MBW5383596.1 hypothetical protein [Brachyspira pilosicoli]MBW5392431.1 hypothetical protein [Brachyspira pilosicoli]